jgi:hypothetical protein
MSSEIKNKKVIPNFSSIFSPELNVKAFYPITKMTSEKHAKKIETFLPEVQRFYLLCKDFDLNGKYKVDGFEEKIKGIDLLKIMDLMKREQRKTSIVATFKNQAFNHTNLEDSEFMGLYVRKAN